MENPNEAMGWLMIICGLVSGAVIHPLIETARLQNRRRRFVCRQPETNVENVLPELPDARDCWDQLRHLLGKYYQMPATAFRLADRLEEVDDLGYDITHFFRLVRKEFGIELPEAQIRPAFSSKSDDLARGGHHSLQIVDCNLQDLLVCICQRRENRVGDVGESVR